MGRKKKRRTTHIVWREEEEESPAASHPLLPSLPLQKEAWRIQFAHLERAEEEEEASSPLQHRPPNVNGPMSRSLHVPLLSPERTKWRFFGRGEGSPLLLILSDVSGLYQHFVKVLPSRKERCLKFLINVPSFFVLLEILYEYAGNRKNNAW